MALQFQTISIPFRRGIDTKTDEKLVEEGLLLSLENGVFTKAGSIRKRYGTQSQSQSIFGTTSSISDGDGLATFNDELVLFGDDNLYTRSSGNVSWINKGKLTSVKITNSQIFKNSYSQTQADGASSDGITVYAWEDSRGGVRASVIDESTGANFINDTQISATGSRPRCIHAGNFLYVWYYENPNLRFVKIPIGNPSAFTSATTAQSDINTTSPNYDLVRVGDNIVCAYNTTTPSVKLFYIRADGVVSPSTLPSAVTIAESAANCLGIWLRTNALMQQQIHVAYHNSTNGLRCFARDSSFVQIFAPVTVDSDVANTFVNVTGATSNATADSSVIFYEQRNSTNASNTLTKSNTITQTGTAGTAQVFKRSVGLASKAFTQGVRTYVNIVHDSLLQSTIFTAYESGEILTRILPGEAGGLRTKPFLPFCFETEANTCNIATAKKNLIVTGENSTTTLSGVNKTSFLFDDDSTFRGVQLGENLHVIGGMLFDYDGVNITEHGFHVFPENTVIDDKAFRVTIAQQGTGVLPEISHVSFMHGDKIQGGQYWTLTSAVPTDYYVWYRKDGVGVDPAPAGKTGIQVDILSTDDASTVATKTSTALNAVGGAPFSCTTNNFTLIVTNTANAAVADAANFDMGLGGMTITVTTQGDGSNAEVATIACPPASLITSGEYLFINAALDAKEYYVWFNKDSAGIDPKIDGKIGIEVAIAAANTAAQVATALNTALNPIADWTSTVATSTVTVTNVINGATTDAKNVNVCSQTVGQMSDGTYGYAFIYQWEDAKGQVHRSAVDFKTAEVNGQSNKGKVTATIPTLRVTTKPNVVVHVFRTEANGTIYYRVSSISSPLFSSTSQDSVIFTDKANDSAITSSELLYTTGGIVENISPPSCHYSTVHNNRLVIATSTPNVLFYSKEYRIEEGLGFNEDFSLTIDPDGGDVKAIAAMDNYLIIFKDTQIRAIAGSGPNDTGQQNDFTDDQLVSSDVGIGDTNSIVLFDKGLMFKSKKGIYMIDRSLQVSYIGAPVEDFNDEVVTSAVLLADNNEIRFTTRSGQLLCYNYFFNEWSTFTNYQAEDAIVWNDEYYHLKSNGLLKKEEVGSFQDDGSSVQLKIETAWIKLGQLQGFKRVRRAAFLGDYESAHSFIVDMAFDYQNITSNTVVWNPVTAINTTLYGSDSPYGSGTPYGGSGDTTYQVRIHMPRQKCESVKYTLRDNMTSTYGASYSISDLTLEVASKGVINKMRAAKTL